MIKLEIKTSYFLWNFENLTKFFLVKGCDINLHTDENPDSFLEKSFSYKEEKMTDGKKSKLIAYSFKVKHIG